MVIVVISNMNYIKAWLLHDLLWSKKKSTFLNPSHFNQMSDLQIYLMKYITTNLQIIL